MSENPSEFEWVVETEADGVTIAALLRRRFGDRSWSKIRAMIHGRTVRVNGGLTLDDSRRVRAGDQVSVGEISRTSTVPARIVVRHVDPWLAVIEKPVDVLTERRKEERNWSDRKKQMQPTAVEQTAEILARQLADVPSADRRPRRMLTVHRLDRETSGLMVIARTKTAQAKLIDQFRRREVRRIYWAAVLGEYAGGTIDTWIHRDRGDGLRGSGSKRPGALNAITHVNMLESLGSITLCECRLETGRTNQIRIHLAEAGHLVCGEKKYNRRLDGSIIEDPSGATRLALHSRRLEFTHPLTQQPMHWESPLPTALERWIADLRQDHGIPGDG